ncbi:OmpA family protein [Brevibacterium ravenspurgense]|uniref:OmpA family protein n=1 Tax=Brevibacterium ravenspurgense TaxID=479117 RepID=UPI0002D4C01A|nr:OmpA family protein [Brevibacterium ravenspurgense]
MKAPAKFAAVGLVGLMAFGAAPAAAAVKAEIDPIKAEIVPLKDNIEPMDDTREDAGEKVVTLSSDVLFDLGKWDLSDGAKKKIAELVKKVPQNATVRVEGHTDNLPYKEGNDVLSKRRAEAVSKAIKEARSDIKTEVKGFGDSKPVEPNEKGGKDNPEGREKNRRVEIRYDG